MNRPRKKDRHLPRSVYHRHGAFYYVKAGKWHPLGKSLAVALAEYARRFENPGSGLDALIDRALDAMEARTAQPLAKATLAQYAIAAEKLKRMLRDFADPREVTARDFVDIRKGMAATPNMANRVLSFGRMVFEHALEEGAVDANPALGVKRLPEKKRDRLIGFDELQAIYVNAGPRLRVIIDLLIRTGQRINDVLAIRRADISADGIYFRQQKTGAKVLVPMTPELDEVIARAKHLNGNIVALTLLHNRRGKRPDYRSVLLQWHQACEAAGVDDATPHDLRAMAATWGKRQGKDATALLGHSSSQQTTRYLRDRETKVAEGPSFGQLLDTETK